VRISGAVLAPSRFPSLQLEPDGSHAGVVRRVDRRPRRRCRCRIFVTGGRLRGLVWHPDAVERWTRNCGFYEVNSMYLAWEEAWTYELTGPYETPGSVAGLAVVIPEATPEGGPFTSMGSARARVVVASGQLPWPVLLRFLSLVEASGGIVAAADDPAVTGDLALSLNSWQFAGRQFAVNSFPFDGRGSWCYELYETRRAYADNDYIDVGIPDLPASRRAVRAGRG
jgi:hypothetical protein